MLQQSPVRLSPPAPLSQLRASPCAACGLAATLAMPGNRRLLVLRTGVPSGQGYAQVKMTHFQHFPHLRNLSTEATDQGVSLPPPPSLNSGLRPARPTALRLLLPNPAIAGYSSYGQESLRDRATPKLR